MLAQILWKGKKIAEVTCPTLYFKEASSINFRRSVQYGFGCLGTALTLPACENGAREIRNAFRRESSVTGQSAIPAGRRLVISLALLITLLGLALRLYRISNQSFWTDELYSVMTSRVPLSQITEVSAGTNNCLATYFLLLRVVVGESNQDIEFRARLISALAGTLSIPVFMGVVGCWRRRADVALAAGLLPAVNPLHIWYSQETRAYALMLFLGLLSLLCYEMARQTCRARWWAGYVVAALVAIALHRTAIISPSHARSGTGGMSSGNGISFGCC